MFNLEQSIADWRRQMLAAGIQTPMPLQELEGHLRESIQERMQSGLTEQAAFESSVLQMGEAGALRSEFAKVTDTILERLKQLFCTFAGIPNYQLATNMNSSKSNLEPGWATYLKTAAFIVPAVMFWVGACVLIVPKVKEICVASGMALSKPVLAALVMMDFIRRNFIAAVLVILITLVLLEWRSHWWARYRRLVFGLLAFLLNLIALILMTSLCVCAVLAGANLLHAK